MQTQTAQAQTAFDAAHPIPLAEIAAPIAERLGMTDFHAYGRDTDDEPFRNVEFEGYDARWEERTHITLSVSAAGNTLDLDHDAEGSRPGSVPIFESVEHAILWLGDFMSRFRPLPV